MTIFATLFRRQLFSKPASLTWCQAVKMSSKPTGSTDSAECASTTSRTLIGVCQMTATSNKEENLKILMNLISRASSMGAKMVFLPEACDYIGESKKQSVEMSEPMDGNFISQCQKAAVENKTWLSIGGYHQKGPDTDPTKLLNTHVIISDKGEVKAAYVKNHLFDLDIVGKVRFYESDYSIPGSKIVPPVETPVGRIGLAICYDMRFAEMALSLARQGAHILAYPSAFTQTTGMAHWESILRARAIETQCYVVAAAQTGKHNEKRSSYGHAMVIDPWGAITAQCSEGTGVCIAEVDLSYLNKIRSEMPVWQHRRTDLYGQVNSLDGSAISLDEDSVYEFGHVKITSDQVFYRSQLCIASVNIKPVLPGHCLVLPIRSAIHITDLTPAEVTDLFTIVQKVSDMVMHHFGATSVTVAVQDGPEAGQTVQHLHVHVIPRKKGDFEDNDDIYGHIEGHDKGWNAETKLRSREEMATESLELRKYFYPS